MGISVWFCGFFTLLLLQKVSLEGRQNAHPVLFGAVLMIEEKKKAQQFKT